VLEVLGAVKALRSSSTLRLVTAVCLSVATAGACSHSESSHASDFRALARERGVLPAGSIDDSTIDEAGRGVCSADYSMDELVTFAQTTHPSAMSGVDATPASFLTMQATLIDAYCPGERAKVEGAAREVGVTLPPGPGGAGT
jgi:hypothetical protein